MNEKITSRINRLVNSSLNNFVDSLEKKSPEMVMEEAIREVSRAVDDIRVELGRVIAKKHLTQVRLTEEEHNHKSLSEQISIALDNQREELAKAAIAKQLKIESKQLVLQSTLENCSQQKQELEAYLMALVEKQQGMSNEFSRLMFSQQEQGHYQNENGVTVEACIDNAESTFNRLLNRQTGFNHAADFVNRSETIQLSQLEQLSKQTAIKKRLALLKAQKE